MINNGLLMDPIFKAGQIGVIASADTLNDDFLVRFEDGKLGLYAADALMVPRRSDQIYEHLQHHSGELSPQDFMNLKNIALLHDYGTPAHVKVALQLAQKHESLRELGLVSMEDEQRNQQVKYGR
jgi:hypothetical protein